MFRLLILSVSLAALAACTVPVDSNPPRTATEELLISTAADRAAAALTMNIPENTPVFVDSNSFDGTDSKYAAAAIRASVLRQGARLVDDKKNAKMIVLARAGALSTDRKSFLIGSPSFSIPIPLSTSSFTIPEIALYGDESQKGVAKFAVSVYDAKTGRLIDEPPPQFGYANNDKQTAAIFISWRSNDILPDDDQTMDNEGRISDKKPSDGDRH